jgi:hypothetical protein
MRAFPLACAFAFAACGARTDLGTRSSAGDAAPAYSALVLNTCGPADGPAITFAIDTGAVCGGSLMQQPGTWINFWASPLPSAPGTYAIGNGKLNGSSGAQVCTTAMCDIATGGTLTLTEMNATAAAGSYSLDLSDGTTVAGSFTAVVCHNLPLCG